MVFSDLFFLYAFLPAFMLFYLLAGGIDKGMGKSFAVRNATIVVFSLLFYAWGEPVYVLLMLACVLVNYFAGIGIADSRGWLRKAALAVGVLDNVLILSLFKYASFISRQLCGLGIDVPDLELRLPIGISFYTFQSISYLVDVYRHEAPVQRKLGGLLLYVSLFPQLIAGPIVRYGTIAHEIKQRKVTAADFADGMFRFLVGLGKKVIFANQLSEISGQLLHDGYGQLTTTGAWVGIVAFTLQIYFDFSGYSERRISTIPTVATASPTSGAAGTCRWAVSSATMSISPWVATGATRLSTSSSYGSSRDCGTGRVGTSSSGACISASS